MSVGKRTRQVSFHRTYGSGLMIARNQKIAPNRAGGITATARPVRSNRPHRRVSHAGAVSTSSTSANSQRPPLPLRGGAPASDDTGTEGRPRSEERRVG